MAAAAVIELPARRIRPASPLPNRVDPLGTLFATPARGLLMGNRGGRFHEPGLAELPARRRPWMSVHWIACETSFKDRAREVWGTGYTELFFLDEITALAAGHRPCFECRRQQALAFRAAMIAGYGEPLGPTVAAIDAVLHEERLDGRHKRLWLARLDTLPDGAVVLAHVDGRDLTYAVRGDALLPWTPEAYGAPRLRPKGDLAVLVTPPGIIGALREGYQPLWHPSAG